MLPLPPASSELTRFEVQLPDQAVNDLHSRLRSVRWPEKEPVSDWTQGVPLSELQDLIGYWRDGYDWRRVRTPGGLYPAGRIRPGEPGRLVGARSDLP
jgi:hypothetical protein